MPRTTRMEWRYPVGDQKDWWEIWVALMNQQDSDVYASMEDPALKLRGGGIITLDTGTDDLTWSEDLELVSTLTGLVITIAAGTLAGFTEGQIAYIDIARPLNSNRTATLAKTSALGVDSSKTFIALRKDDAIYMRNGGAGEQTITQRVEHTSANVTSGGGSISGSFDIGVSNGFVSGWIVANGNTVDSNITFYADASLSEELGSFTTVDFYADPVEVRFPLQSYGQDALVGRTVYYVLLNSGLNDSTYTMKLNPIGAK